MAYTIKSGDTLSKIAKANNTTIKDIMAANPNITNANLIKAGANLVMPGTTPQPAAQTTAQPAPSLLDQFNAMLKDSGGSQVSGAYGGAMSGYSNATAAQKAALNAQQKSREQEIADAYENTRKQAYVNGRLNAIGNNEQLAALGLSGNLYDTPRSGYTETSRINENLQMRNAIAGANTQEQADINKLALEIMQKNADIDMESAQFMAQMQIQMAQAEEAARQNKQQRDLSILQTLLNQQNADREFNFAQQQYADAMAAKSTGGSGGGSRSTTSGNASNDFAFGDANVNNSIVNGYVSAIMQTIPASASGDAVRVKANRAVEQALNTGKINYAEADAILTKFGG